MVNISNAVEEMFHQDEVATAAASRGWLNLSSYARSIQPEVERRLQKSVGEGSIITALSRLTASRLAIETDPTALIQSLGIHSNLVGLTYERSDGVSRQIRTIYHRVAADNKTFLTVTQGINEITVIAEARVAGQFRERLEQAQKIYDKQSLVGITVKFELGNLEEPNLIYHLTRRLAQRNINIIEVVSTATELTFIIDKADVAISLAQLQKDL